MGTDAVCGTPSAANYHFGLVIGRGDRETGTETDSLDLYMCAAHAPEDPGTLIDKSDRDAGWSVLESEVTYLRGTHRMWCATCGMEIRSGDMEAAGVEHTQHDGAHYPYWIDSITGESVFEIA